MMAAVEQLPAEFSDLNRTKLSAHIGSQGGRFNFDVVAPVPAKDKAADNATGESKAGDKVDAETKTADKEALGTKAVDTKP